MSEVSSSWTMGAGATVMVGVSALLWLEFHTPGHTGWNVFLTVVLGAIMVAAYFLQRFFRSHIHEIGEARFDSNSDQGNG